MKKLVMAAAALALSAGTATAQDAAYDWSGAYIGAQVGYGWSGSDAWLRLNSANLHYFPLEPKGALGGLYAGYNHQFVNKAVLGAEIDIAASDINADATLLYDLAGVVVPNNVATAKLKWSGALRGRVGYAFDRILPYATAGIVFGRYEVIPDYAYTPPLPGEKTHVGWTIGAGVEYALTEKLTTRIDYRYSDFGSMTYATPGFPNNDTRVDLKTQDIRLGIAYKF